MALVAGDRVEYVSGSCGSIFTLIPARSSPCWIAWAWLSDVLSLALTRVSCRFDFPAGASSCLALATSPDAGAGYRSYGWRPGMPGVISVLARSPPWVPPAASWKDALVHGVLDRLADLDVVESRTLGVDGEVLQGAGVRQREPLLGVGAAGDLLELCRRDEAGAERVAGVAGVGDELLGGRGVVRAELEDDGVRTGEPDGVGALDPVGVALEDDVLSRLVALRPRKGRTRPGRCRTSTGSCRRSSAPARTPASRRSTASRRTACSGGTRSSARPASRSRRAACPGRGRCRSRRPRAASCGSRARPTARCERPLEAVLDVLRGDRLAVGELEARLEL